MRPPIVAGPRLFLDGRPFTRTMAADRGVSRRVIDRKVAAGELTQPVRGTYVDRRVELSPTVRARAAALVLPEGAALARRTAAWVYGVDSRSPGDCRLPLAVECVVPRGVVPPRRRGLAAYASDLPASQVSVVDGLRVTTAARTALDCSRYLPPWQGLATVDALLHAGLTAAGEVAALVECYRGDRWIDRARRVVALAEPLTESVGESWLRLRIVEAGFPRPVAQHVVSDGGGFVARLDLADVEHRIGYEYDGEAHHTNPVDVARDRTRRERLQALGWRVVVARKSDVLGRDTRLEETVAELLGVPAPPWRARWQ